MHTLSSKDNVSVAITTSDAAQQKACFAVGYAIDHADFTQHAVEIGKTARANIGHQVPFAIGGVERSDFRYAAQLANDLRRRFATTSIIITA